MERISMILPPNISLLGMDKKEDELCFGFSITGGTEEERLVILRSVEDLIVGINRRRYRQDR